MKKTSWLYIAIAILICVVFQKAFSAQYVLWDDDALVLNNPLLKLPFWEALKTAFTVYYHGDYFPLTLMSYWFDMNLFGTNAAAQHTENVLLHVVAALLLLDVLRKLTKNDGLSFLITLVFAVHPLQTETVMWISERKSLLSAVFTFLSLRFYLQTYEASKPVGRYSLAMLFYICASLTKTTAIFLPLLFLLIDLSWSEKRWPWKAKRFVPLAVLAGLLVTLRIQAYAASVGFDSASVLSAEYLPTIPIRAFNAIGIYVKMLFWPTSSAIYSDFRMDYETRRFAAFGFALCVVISVLLVRFKDFFLRFSWVWFLLFLLPVLQIIPRINYINERYMYLPIVGIAGCLLWWVKPRHYKALGVILFLLMAYPAYQFTDHWTTNRKLWAQALKTVPENPIALNNLGLDYQNAGELTAASALYEKILALPKDDSNKILAYNNLANIYADTRFSRFDAAKAIALLQEGISKAKRPRDTYEMRVNLGNLYVALGKKPEAEQLFADLQKDLTQESDFHFQWLKPMVEKRLEELRR